MLDAFADRAGNLIIGLITDAGLRIGRIGRNIDPGKTRETVTACPVSPCLGDRSAVLSPVFRRVAGFAVEESLREIRPRLRRSGVRSN